MHVRLIDPRDQQWEMDQPEAYRLTFRSSASSVDDYEISGADIDDVLSWAESHRNGRSYTLWLRVTTSDGLGLVRLLSKDALP